MSDNPTPQASDGPHDAILAEMKGLREVVDTRFDALAREQDNQREWMGRMSSTIDRVSETLSRQVNIETRLAHVEQGQSDDRLDMAALRSDVTAIKEQKTRTGIIVTGIGAVFGAAATLIANKLFGIG